MFVQGIVTLIYALLILAGGVMGYVKASSKISLIMGVSFAVALTVSGIATLKNNHWGFLTSIGLSTLLLLFFGYRFYLTQQFFPSGMMTFLSAIVIIILGVYRVKQ
jgi:uncharacterized membrane protein (UPF0136 family)